jgi:hypothetical protein
MAAAAAAVAAVVVVVVVLMLLLLLLVVVVEWWLRRCEPPGCWKLKVDSWAWVLILVWDSGAYGAAYGEACKRLTYG